MNKTDQLMDTLLLKARLKSEFIDYYESIADEIESKFQRQELNSLYDMLWLKDNLLDKIEHIAMENLKEINNYFSLITSNDEYLIMEDIKLNAIKSFCIFIDDDIFTSNALREKYSPGILVITDFYLDSYHQSFLIKEFQNQTEFLKSAYSPGKNIFYFEEINFNGPSALDIALYNQDYYIEKIKNNFVLDFLAYFIFVIYLALLIIINLISKIQKQIQGSKIALGAKIDKVPLSIEFKY